MIDQREYRIFLKFMFHQACADGLNVLNKKSMKKSTVTIHPYKTVKNASGTNLRISRQ